MRYDFKCPDCNDVLEINWPMNKEFPLVICEHVDTDWEDEPSTVMQRIYTPPVISIPETSAVDVLNRHVRGEGDPLAGYTQAQTKWMANEKARTQKLEKGQKSSSLPTRSYPTGGPKAYYGSD